MAQYEGWPNKIVGGGIVGWAAGDPTDDTDMAMGMMTAFYHTNGELQGVGDSMMNEFQRWRATDPCRVYRNTFIPLVALVTDSY
jgi:hypothetical protein